jgi:cytochrome c oxidase cbb3-type subunit II
MKESIATLTVSLMFLGASLSSAQKSDSTPAKSGKNGTSVYTELAKAPDKARAKRNPFENDPDAVAAGRNLFEQHCAECHGAAAEGGKKGPSLRAQEVQEATPGSIFWILTNGVVRRGMPVWSKLPEPRRWQLVAYIKSLGVSTSSTPSSELQPFEPRVPPSRLSLPLR